MNAHYIQSDNADVIRPSIAMTDITSIVCDMLQDNMDYVSKNGMTDKAKISRERLLTLLNITETFNQISCSNAALKTANEHLFAENSALRKRLKDIENETNLANSI